MKKLETYLHLYLGATIYYPQTNKVATVDWTHILDASAAMAEGKTYTPKFVLALYPIGKMPPKQKADYDKIRSTNYSLDEYEDSIRTCCEVTNFLIKHRVDVFQLIEAGLAVNFLTIKKHVKK